MGRLSGPSARGADVRRFLKTQTVRKHKPLPLGSGYYDWSRIGPQRGIYTVNRDGTGQKQVTEIEEIGIRSLTWSPDGNELLYTKPEDGLLQLYKFNLRTEKTIQLTQVGNNFDAVWFDPSPSPLSVKLSDALLTTTRGKVKNRN